MNAVLDVEDAAIVVKAQSSLNRRRRTYENQNEHQGVLDTMDNPADG